MTTTAPGVVLVDADWNAERAALFAATADETSLRAMLAELNTGGDTPIYDGMCPPEVVERVLDALRIEATNQQSEAQR